MNNNRYKLLKIDHNSSSDDELNNNDDNNDDNNDNDNEDSVIIVDNQNTLDDNKINKFKKIISKPIYSKKYYKVDRYNHKKILCQNYITNKTCSYDIKCLYAHSLAEQKIDIKRKKIFELLENTSSLENLDPLTLKELNVFTRLCNDCISHKCSGGYNCKLGAPMKKYYICYDDLNYGHCSQDTCSKIHLTKRGLKPQYNHLNTNKTNISNIHMLIPFINNLNILNNNLLPAKDNIIANQDNNKNIKNNDNDNDLDCLESIFIDKYKMIDCIN